MKKDVKEKIKDMIVIFLVMVFTMICFSPIIWMATGTVGDFIFTFLCFAYVLFFVILIIYKIVDYI